MSKSKLVYVKGRQILVFVFKSDKYYVAEYPFLDIATQGRTEEEALNNVKEAVEIHLRLKSDEIKFPKSEHVASIEINLKA